MFRFWKRFCKIGDQRFITTYFRNQKLRKVGLHTMHSSLEEVRLKAMVVKILPALEDNYMYMIVCPYTRQAAIVDPVDPNMVMDVLKEENIKLTKILTTHHHWDHAGGNTEMSKIFNNTLEVYGGDDRIGSLNHKVQHLEKFKIGNLIVTCLSTPCHTVGHICYFIESPAGDRCVFTGDTLFQGGCGRFFEGTAEQMYDALCQQLASLPEDTYVFCGHEYTLQNMTYAKYVEPENDNILKRIEWAKICRSNRLPTVPSTIAQEKMWNPFMRVNIPTIQKHASATDPISTMNFLRKEKDNFKS